LIGIFWVLFEASKEPLQQALSSPLAVSFVAGGGCSLAAWAVAFPLDVCKSRSQALPREGGFAAVGWSSTGLYRGVGFGLARTFVANGCAMIIYDIVYASLS